MPVPQTFRQCLLPLRVEGVELRIATAWREGEGAPILFLHGFGSSKEDYLGLTRQPAFAGRPFLAYDAPGCGQSQCADLGKVSIPLLLGTALQVLEHFDVERFHLVGHSMGGLTALLLAQYCPQRVISFVDIEGNIAPEDCFLSRQIVDYPADDPEAFFADFIERTRHGSDPASALYAASLPYKVRAGAVRGIFSSMVELSDHGQLMDRFLGLRCPRMFMYGEQNSHLSYLAEIQRQGVELASIPGCGHFPMYSNPIEMWRRIADFQARCYP
ncbi:alpha/beta fold hydrolase [Pseudomonas sichuanensis]|uniref:alpha/beta fold hydrolase n=1 Tax=Pseudomonas TaxID=286 RepID=UPI00380C0876